MSIRLPQHVKNIGTYKTSALHPAPTSKDYTIVPNKPTHNIHYQKIQGRLCPRSTPFCYFEKSKSRTTTKSLRFIQTYARLCIILQLGTVYKIKYFVYLKADYIIFLVSKMADGKRDFCNFYTCTIYSDHRYFIF